LTDNPTSTAFDETSEVPERALRIYARLWQFETWLRRVVYVELRALLGDQWSAGLSVNGSSFNADKTLRHMPTPEMNALSYASLSQLTKLIDANWACFELYLPPQALWNAKLIEISQIRHRMAHFRVGHVDDYPRLLQFMRDIDRGFWTFCTSYNNALPILPVSRDRVTQHFVALDPLPWGEVEPNQWARIGAVDRSETVGMTVNVLRRPWASTVETVDGSQGYLYDIMLQANDGRKFDYGALLEQTRRLHEHLVHVGLDQFEDTIRVTAPAVLGSEVLIPLVETLLGAARNNVRRGRNPSALDAHAVAADWPEYVLGPRDPLTYLAPDMHCSFFSA
jgi:hypothetical protein